MGQDFEIAGNSPFVNSQILYKGIYHISLQRKSTLMRIASGEVF